MDTIQKSNSEILFQINKKLHKNWSFSDQINTHKGSFILYVALRIIIFSIMIMQLMNQDYHNVFICILTLGLFIVPSFFEIRWNIRLPNTFQNMILLYIFSAEILGEIAEFYLLFPWWDTILHMLNGFWVAAIGFSFTRIFTKSDKTEYEIAPILAVVIAFCFSMTIGVFWEFFEFMVDRLFLGDMQKDTIMASISSITLNPTGRNIPATVNNITSVAVNGQELGLNGYLDIGLIDTMKDLFVNLIGASIFSLLCFLHLKSGGKGRFIKNFMIDKNK